MILQKLLSYDSDFLTSYDFMRHLESSLSNISVGQSLNIFSVSCRLFRTKVSFPMKRQKTLTPPFFASILLFNFQAFLYCWRRLRQDPTVRCNKGVLNHTAYKKTPPLGRQSEGRDGAVKEPSHVFSFCRMAVFKDFTLTLFSISQ